MFHLLQQLPPITHHHRGPRPAQSARTECLFEKARYFRDSTQPLKWMAHGESGLTPEQRDAGKHWEGQRITCFQYATRPTGAWQQFSVDTNQGDQVHFWFVPSLRCRFWLNPFFLCFVTWSLSLVCSWGKSRSGVCLLWRLGIKYDSNEVILVVF